MSVRSVFQGKEKDLGGLIVRRVLPHPEVRSVGPFLFLDHFGPASLPKGEGIDVRPHPHINLATVSYLFEGELIHRDSLGVRQAIRPGAINWMTAGSGIVHSERSGDGERSRASSLHGIQLWLGLPKIHEETEPTFVHHPAQDLPTLDVDGVKVRLLVGHGFGASSPVRVLSPMLYAEVEMREGASLSLPHELEERALYVVRGQLSAGSNIPECHLAVLGDGHVVLSADRDTRLMLLFGDRLDGPRHMFWNFVSSRKERIEEAKIAWKDRRFPLIPGDEEEWIPLPE